jgi:FXSXX-COOH protein
MLDDRPDYPSELRSDLLDLSDVDLATLAALPADAFAVAVRRALRDAQERRVAYAVFDRGPP